jgi:N-acetyl-gamma-glutamyl-phosphate/LysW-gamma-L-alpha-aminoadipyl-6-phosphate reductase
MLSVAVVGASGYIGGELLRLLLGHPRVSVDAATSERLAGRRIDGAHPNLRGVTDLSFRRREDLGRYDVVFLALPHTETMGKMAAEYLSLASIVVDLSGDFRLRDTEVYRRYYGVPHEAPELISSFTPGLPELYRDRLRTADRISVPGCMAVAGILALHPLAAGGLIAGDVTVDARTGSSGSGSTVRAENQHAERSGAMRVFAPTRHRHEAEIGQAIGRRIRMSATGIEAVRGVQVLCRAALTDPGASERAVREAYRGCYGSERFVRVVAQRRGLHRLPEPKILSGSNFCDVGFVVDDEAGSVLAVGALDNLVKGGAGNAVQSMNLRLGWPEQLGLEFAGLHPN